jgi:hypothetical protein
MVDSRSDGTSTAIDTTELNPRRIIPAKPLFRFFRKSLRYPSGSFQPAAYRFPASRIVTNSWLTNY